MSLVQDLGARVQAACTGLPTGEVAVAMQRLRGATELLMWVRQTSVDPIGVPQLAGAVEHAEHAAAALRIAQDTLAGYLAAIGLTHDAERPPDAEPGPLQPPEGPRSGPAPAEHPPPERVGTWWGTRVTRLTGQPPAQRDTEATGGRRSDTADLLRRVAAGVRAGDRAQLGRDLHAVNAAAGLRLSAITPALLRRLAGDLLGHEPRPEDLPRLRGAAAERTRALLPGIAPDLIDTLLARVCRAPAATGTPAHPADFAVTSGVLTGVLLARLGRHPGTLDPGTLDPGTLDPGTLDPGTLDPGTAAPDPRPDRDA
jgi:hypothetical protein